MDAYFLIYKGRSSKIINLLDGFFIALYSAKSFSFVAIDKKKGYQKKGEQRYVFNPFHRAKILFIKKV